MVNVCFRKLSSSRVGQFVEIISLAVLQSGPYLIGNTIGALFVSLAESHMYVLLLVNGYSRRMDLINSCLYPLSINFSFSCLSISRYVCS